MVRVLTLCALLTGAAVAQDRSPAHGSRPESLAIENVFVVRGDGTPPYGPTTVLIENGVIVNGGAGPATDRKARFAIDGEGCYLLPGLVNTHGHLQERAAGIAMPMDYQLSLWLACGITAVRDVGSAWSRSVRMRSRREKGELVAPRLFLYHGFGAADDPRAASRRVATLKKQGVDGIKLWSNYSYRREVLAAILEEARRQELRVTAHIGVGETNALDYAGLGVTSIEHWYGIPDAAVDGVQSFPPDFSYSNEVDRFRWAGRLWREADPEQLQEVLRYLVDLGVAWSPTLAVYEASRDLVRAQNKPWFDDYLHPALGRFFSPNLAYHGSYFIGWTSADEAYWRENYRIWMTALRDFETMGGTITTGEDAGYIYLLYGFGLVREMELHLEAGFHPLEVIRHATYNGARVLGLEGQFGRVLNGMAADLCLVRGNPLQNLKCLYPTGTDRLVDGKSVPTGGVQYTIVDGRVYHGPTLASAVRAMVAEARAKDSGTGGGK